MLYMCIGDSREDLTVFYSRDIQLKLFHKNIFSIFNTLRLYTLFNFLIISDLYYIRLIVSYSLIVLDMILVAESLLFKNILDISQRSWKILYLIV